MNRASVLLPRLGFALFFLARARLGFASFFLARAMARHFHFFVHADRGKQPFRSSPAPLKAAKYSGCNKQGAAWAGFYRTIIRNHAKHNNSLFFNKAPKKHRSSAALGFFYTPQAALEWKFLHGARRSPI